MENYIRFEFPEPAGATQELLLAELSSWPFEGFEEQDRCLVAFIPESDCDSELRSFLVEICHQHNWSKLKEEIIAPQNWNAEWEKQYEAVIVNDFCAVRASFHEPIKQVEHEIVITPKMSFGTGHHATTYMMMLEMKSCNFRDKVVLDYGCGTSVLAILAAKLGAKHVDAVDIDYWAYENSLENVSMNAVEKQISVFEGDWDAVPEKQYDIVLANINRHIIMGSMEEMVNCLSGNGELLCSGFLDTDVDMINKEAEASGMILVNTLSVEKWRCLHFRKLS
jgi:ribosomal protein L11 methyltransferase